MVDNIKHYENELGLKQMESEKMHEKIVRLLLPIGELEQAKNEAGEMKNDIDQFNSTLQYKGKENDKLEEKCNEKDKREKILDDRVI